MHAYATVVYNDDPWPTAHGSKIYYWLPCIFSGWALISGDIPTLIIMSTTPPATASITDQRLLCRDRMFPTKHVPDLPRTCCSLSIDYASETELPALRRMVLDSARRGDNVGLDEYEGCGDVDDVGSKDDAFSLLINTSEMFVARHLDCDDEPQAFILLQPCMYTR